MGAYAYLDGVMFMRISMAMDAIMQDVMAARPNTAIAYLATPTDAHVMTAAAQEAARGNLRRAPLWQKLLKPLLRGKGMKPNISRPVEAEDGDQHIVVDAIVVEQGPNYILSKRLQHWRAVLARANGHIVSANVAPSTATVSVVHNRQFKWAYGGMPNFKPVEIFQQETSASVMTMLLLNDVHNPQSYANPNTQLRTPYGLFTGTSFHGGAWRTGYKFGTIGIPSVLSYFVGSVITPAYLTVYNGVQAAGWSVALYKAVNWLMNKPAGENMWQAAGGTLGFFQYWAMLEVLHCLLGAVKSPVFTTAQQVASRVLLVAVANATTAQQDNVFLQMMVMAWSITEVVRYAYYALSLNKISVGFLTFLRYTMFLVLYPMGVLGELGVIHAALPALAEASKTNEPTLFNHFSKVVNSSNVYWFFLVPFYAVGLSQLYGYMLGQRKKVLGGGKGKGKGKGKKKTA
eukprot:NODE_496_length_1870_cov_37.802065_g489_i0.p2 GENE.NODE_496_length_1870_cov_37.802065_g489_i0~~NODE_496_length_1870_cov_37.802065_g489_i0.p2  ORF type:complete len:459 (+),score=141.21 NODE_496_length_1870_cov_37.802065_g489_i0:398-1774(+)